MGSVAMTVHEQVSEKTDLMEEAIYAALEAIDDYRATIERLIGDQESSAEPNEMLDKRLHQFAGKAETMTRIVEDEVVTELLFCIDRLFAVELAERGEFI